MTTSNLLPFKDIKDFDSYYWLIKELIELKQEVTYLRDQSDCTQKSIANLRSDLFSKEQNKDRSFWIHW